LSYLVANKQFLVRLEIINCGGISSEGYHCLTTLTNLTSLTIVNSKLDDIGLNMICSSCLLIEYLDIKFNGLITIEGLNNIHCLIDLKSFFLSGASDDWLAKLSYCTALTQLDLYYNSTVSDEGLLQLSSLVKLTSVNVNSLRKI
jgi:Leucine-rich repeat (LRR) protein